MQQENRIKNMFYALFGGTFFLLLVLIGGYFIPTGFGYRKLQTDIKVQEDRIQASTPVADRLGKAQEAKVKAEIDQEAANAQLGYFQTRYFSLNIGNIAPDTSNPNLAYQPLYTAFNKWLSVYRGGDSRVGTGSYGRELQDELDNAVRISGVSYSAAAASTSAGAAGGSAGGRSSTSGSLSTTGTQGGQTAVARPAIAIPAELAPKNPEDVPGLIPNNGLLTPVARIDTLAVRGDLGSILRFFQIITSSRSNILKTVSPVKLDGSSPNLVATFSLSPYLIIRGASAPITATYGAAAGASTGTAGTAGTAIASSTGGNGVTP